mgnify:CR=1 FL=1
MEHPELYRTVDLKTAVYLLYSGAKLLKVEPVTADRPDRLHFVLEGVAAGARTAPGEGELVELPKYLRVFEKAKIALTNAARIAGHRP